MLPLQSNEFFDFEFSSTEEGFEKRPTVQLGMSLASGTQLHQHEDRKSEVCAAWYPTFDPDISVVG